MIMPYLSKKTVYRRALNTGEIEIKHQASAYSCDALFDMAERRNPKRAFLFVSKVLGRHIPVSPRTMRAVYKQLTAQFPKSIYAVHASPILFIGMAETAVGLGAGVFDEMQSRIPNAIYLTSTRHPIPGELLCEFKESHSHATDHLLYLPDNAELRQRVTQARTLVLIDDEATTGNTFMHLIEALSATNKLQHLQQIITITLTDWSGNALQKRCSLPVTCLALIKGSWHWQPKPDAAVPTMPAVSLTAAGKEPITGKQSWGRLGMAAAANDLGRHIKAKKGEKLLVLGSNEFVWEPFLLAERLENEGADVKFSSTTRSPIATGFAIESMISFSDNYGLGIPNFVYNVAQQQLDRILLCVETPVSSVDPLLLRALAKVAPSVEVISYQSN